MKRLSIAIILACFTLAVAAQEGIQVKYQGAKPTIRDFAKAYLYSLFNPEDGGEPEGDGLYLYESLQQAIASQDKKLPLKKGTALTIDLRNGFLFYEEKQDEFLTRVEMCFWNESDGKHRIFACSRWTFENDKAILGQYDGLSFYRYDNAKKVMERCNTPGFDVEYLNKTYALPRTGKDIIVTTWHENGNKTQKTLKWNGHGFSY